MKIHNYFYEIQYRFFFFTCCLILNIIILSYYREELFFLLGQHQSKDFPYFIATNLTEVFIVSIKLIIFLSIYSTLPFLLLQIWLFLIPALYEYEYKIMNKIFFLSFLVYIIASVLVIEIMLPLSWTFFSSFEMNTENNGISIQLEAKLSDYINFFFDIFFLLNMGAHFLLLFYIFIDKLKVNSLIKFRKLIYLSLFILATITTPPDIFSQILIGSFLIFSYEILLFSFFLSLSYKKLKTGE